MLRPSTLRTRRLGIASKMSGFFYPCPFIVTNVLKISKFVQGELII